jgi:hypothetical protein
MSQYFIREQISSKPPINLLCIIPNYEITTLWQKGIQKILFQGIVSRDFGVIYWFHWIDMSSQ